MRNDLDTGIVKKALDECAVEFERGLNSLGSPTFTISQDIVKRLREGLVSSFDANLGGVGQPQWDADGARVRGMAFYLGAIAAFNSYPTRRLR